MRGKVQYDSASGVWILLYLRAPELSWVPHYPQLLRHRCRNHLVEKLEL